MNENGYYVNFQEPTPDHKKMSVKIVCGNGCTENDLIHLSLKKKIYHTYMNIVVNKYLQLMSSL